MITKRTLKYYLLISTISLLTLGSMESCTSSRNAAHGWTDLTHARKLDKMKGMRSKKYQKNVARHSDY